MPNELTQPHQPLSQDANIATLLYLLHAQALGATVLPNLRSASHIDQLLRALANNHSTGALLRETCEELSESWGHVVQGRIAYAGGCLA